MTLQILMSVNWDKTFTNTQSIFLVSHERLMGGGEGAGDATNFQNNQ